MFLRGIAILVLKYVACFLSVREHGRKMNAK